MDADGRIRKEFVVLDEQTCGVANFDAICRAGNPVAMQRCAGTAHGDDLSSASCHVEQLDASGVLVPSKSLFWMVTLPVMLLPKMSLAAAVTRISSLLLMRTSPVIPETLMASPGELISGLLRMERLPATLVAEMALPARFTVMLLSSIETLPPLAR